MLNDRREGPDILVRVLKLTSVVGWLLILIALILMFVSQPEMDTGIVRYRGLEIRDYWLSGWLNSAAIFMVMSSLSSLVAWVVHRKRSRRVSDLPSSIIITLALISFVGVLILMRLLSQ